MSLPLVKHDLNITQETDAWVKAKSVSTGISQEKLLRKALHAIAVSEFLDATLMIQSFESKGITKVEQGD
jgi:hypothetical protein